MAADTSVKGPEAKGEQAHEGNGKGAVLKALLVFAILGALAFFYWLLFAKGTISTDDAYTQGNIVRVYPQTSGTVVEILAESTQLVGEGDVLARLDPTDAALALEKAEGALEQATRAVASRLSERERLRAALDGSRSKLAQSQADFERRRKLAPGTSITREELESRRIQVEIDRASVAAAEAALAATERLIGPGPPEGDPAIREAAAMVLSAWLNLRRTEIRSPVQGRVAKRSVQLGNQVGPSSPLLMVVPETEVWVDANFKESQLAKVVPGQRAEVTVDMLGGGRTFHGVVVGLSPGTGSAFSLLPAENATGNWIKVVQRVPVRIALVGVEGGGEPPPLLVGLSCTVKVFLEETGKAPDPPPVRSTDATLIDLESKRREVEATIARNLGPRDGPTADAGGAGAQGPSGGAR
ncbi:MAG: HlyD family efflux transporter periplasmic adaptor subunit [Deltaproteobacteria bacterium]|jgi:membrane fusion protein (multidrug efflux system)|nr:HlyD family efflux transporter periplasmic adaptor subunit [Deltaproteobacteria bacterium]